MREADSLGGPTAWSVKRLALDWGCCPSVIYKMIDNGDLATFTIGKRGIRITDREKRRCEDANQSLTATETSPSASERATLLPTIAMRMISAAARG